jgi:threonine aldolase
MPERPIDLRSDTVTRPTAAMMRAMAQAELGDDVLGDDPTVNRLQEQVAALLGKEAACFVPSGTMANQAAIRAHTEPGDEIIAHADSHIIHYETGAPAAIAGCMIAPLAGAKGQFTAEDVRRAIRKSDYHAPRSRLLVVENTHNRGGGSVWSMDAVRSVTDAARESGLRTHLDGARLWNACAASGRQPREYAQYFDTVSTCFSKGLGAPVGSAVAGSREMIGRVFRFRKMMGGAMRQSGVLAAAALYALENHRERLREDHANARRLAAGVAEIPGLRVDMGSVESNILYMDVDPSMGSAGELCQRLRAEGVWMLPTATQRVRAVTHLDVDAAMIDRAIGIMGRALRQTASVG